MTSKFSTRKARWLRRLSWVPRWAVIPTVHKQNVAEHCFHVISLSRWLLSMHARCDDGNFALGVLISAMEHDADEAQSGDIPSPYKKSGLNTSDQVEVIVKCADKLEALLFIFEETAMGNTLGMQEVQEDIFNKFEKAWDAFEWGGVGLKPKAMEVYHNSTLIAFNKHKPHPAMEEEPYDN